MISPTSHPKRSHPLNREVTHPVGGFMWTKKIRSKTKRRERSKQRAMCKDHRKPQTDNKHSPINNRHQMTTQQWTIANRKSTINNQEPPTKKQISTTKNNNNTTSKQQSTMKKQQARNNNQKSRNDLNKPGGISHDRCTTRYVPNNNLKKHKKHNNYNRINRCHVCEGGPLTTCYHYFNRHHKKSNHDPITMSSLGARIDHRPIWRAKKIKHLLLPPQQHHNNQHQHQHQH